MCWPPLGLGKCIVWQSWGWSLLLYGIIPLPLKIKVVWLLGWWSEDEVDSEFGISRLSSTTCATISENMAAARAENCKESAMPDDVSDFGDDLVRCVYPGSDDISPAEEQWSVIGRCDQWLQNIRRSWVRRTAVKLVSLTFPQAIQSLTR